MGNGQTWIRKAVEQLMTIEQHIPKFIESWISKVITENSNLIGFTSTFHQNCASLSLSREITEAIKTPIIFGGANCEGEMGATLLKIAPWIDFVFSGEADISFIQFIKYLIKGEPLPKINGLLTRESTFFETSLTSPVMDMDTLPYPDFDDYFNSLKKSSYRK